MHTFCTGNLTGSRGVSQAASARNNGRLPCKTTSPVFTHSRICSLSKISKPSFRGFRRKTHTPLLQVSSYFEVSNATISRGEESRSTPVKPCRVGSRSVADYEYAQER
ncbi:hypothetical protein BaRGS_00010371 [Batillaria attramentaria]|uniref:Uncharacterized protein n=1 Tax=Batillaria attramentaria TaxID=370345 RepID=A0ABD0LHA1_9CAEN